MPWAVKSPRMTFNSAPQNLATNNLLWTGSLANNRNGRLPHCRVLRVVYPVFLQQRKLEESKRR